MIDAPRLILPRLGFGASGLGDVATDAATALVYEALDRGFTYFDTSPYYGSGRSEELLGAALRGRRDEVVVATKCGRYGYRAFDHSPSRVRRSFAESLDRLGLDHIDLYQLHDIEFSSRGEVDDGLAELVAMRDEGLVRAVGVTGFHLPLLAELTAAGQLDAVLSYCRGHVLDRGILELVPVAEAAGTAVINASPLCMSLLTEDGPAERHPADEPMRAARDRFAAWAAERGAPLPVVALQYSLWLPGITSTLIGATSSSQLDNALTAAATPLDEALAGVLAGLAIDTPGWHDVHPSHEHQEQHRE